MQGEINEKFKTYDQPSGSFLETNVFHNFPITNIDELTEFETNLLDNAYKHKLVS